MIKLIASVLKKLGLKRFIQRLEWELSREDYEHIESIFQQQDKAA